MKYEEYKKIRDKFIEKRLSKGWSVELIAEGLGIERSIVREVETKFIEKVMKKMN